MFHPATLRDSRRLYLPFILLALSLLLAPIVRAADQVHEFTLDLSNSGDKPKTVAVAGSFNGWSKDATPMTSDGQGRWSAKVSLAEGQYQYKFVLDGDKWIKDPLGDPALEVDDNYQGKNSGLIIGADARKLLAVEENKINVEGIIFKPEEDVNVVTPTLVRIRVRVQAGDIKKAEVKYVGGMSAVPRVTMYPCGESMGFETLAALIDFREGQTFSFWFHFEDGTERVDLTAKGAVELAGGAFPDQPFTISMKPKFETPDWAKTAVWYQIFPERFRNGDPSNDPGDKWYERLIPWTSNWWKAAPNEIAGDENFYKGAGNVWKRRYGGDIQGVQKELPYLRSLGVTAIYFNPVFEAESMHKYDTADYRHIDDNFGVKNDNAVAIAPRPVPETEKKWLTPDVIERSAKPAAESFPLFEVDGTPVASNHVETDDPATWKWTKSDLVFLKFLEEAHKQGFKVILDGVFNHVGRAHPFFQDVLENGKNSRYADWFVITDFGDEKNWHKMADPYLVHGKPGGMQWKAWDGDNGHLPVFKKDDKLGLATGPREHIMAITKRWLAPGGDSTKGIDGWRLDVPGDIPHGFWIDWHKVVKGAKSDAYISGEIWTWAQPWLNNGDQFDAVMNYRFASAAQDFFVNDQKKITPSQLASRLNEMIYNYPLQVAMVQQNLFDSHDTDRFASMFMNPDLVYDASNRIQDNGPDYSPAKPSPIERAKQKLAITLQHTFVGAPMTYYGNETGMWSPDDPSNRQPMWWRDLMPYEDPQIQFDESMFAHYQRLIALRRQLPALSLGFFHTVLVDDDKGIIAFAREYQGQTVYVAINRSENEQTIEFNAPAGEYVNWMDESQATIVPFDPAIPDARPTLKAISSEVKNGKGVLKMTLKPYGDAVLSK
jgi:glycosidase